jgi:hypothetical protein
LKPGYLCRFCHQNVGIYILNVNFDMKLLEFHQLSWQGHFSSSGESALIPGELVKEEHPLINRVIAKKPTASCKKALPGRVPTIRQGKARKER